MLTVTRAVVGALGSRASRAGCQQLRRTLGVKRLTVLWIWLVESGCEAVPAPSVAGPAWGPEFSPLRPESPLKPTWVVSAGFAFVLVPCWFVAAFPATRCGTSFDATGSGSTSGSASGGGTFSAGAGSVGTGTSTTSRITFVFSPPNTTNPMASPNATATAMATRATGEKPERLRPIGTSGSSSELASGLGDVGRITAAVVDGSSGSGEVSAAPTEDGGEAPGADGDGAAEGSEGRAAAVCPSDGDIPCASWTSAASSGNLLTGSQSSNPSRHTRLSRLTEPAAAWFRICSGVRGPVGVPSIPTNHCSMSAGGSLKVGAKDARPEAGTAPGRGWAPPPSGRPPTTDWKAPARAPGLPEGRGPDSSSL